MKKTILTIAMILGSLATGWCDSKPNIIPAPLKMVKGEGSFVVKKGLAIVSTDANDFSANYLQDKLEEVFDFPIALTRQQKTERSIVFVTDKELPQEGYRLDVTDTGITIASADEAGKYYGVQTLLQLFPAEVYSGSHIR